MLDCKRRVSEESESSEIEGTKLVLFRTFSMSVTMARTFEESIAKPPGVDPHSL
jgi:hypothetical protein